MKWLELCAAGVVGFFVISAISDFFYDFTRGIKWKIKPIRVIRKILPKSLLQHFKRSGNDSGTSLFFWGLDEDYDLSDESDSKGTVDKRLKKIWNGSKPIFFIRTSTEPLQSFEHCAFYSAAWHNPEILVIIFSFRVYELPGYLAELGNVESRTLNFSQVFSGTPLQQWYESGIWNVTAFVRRVRYLSDATRHAFLLKHGGVYLDTDMISLRNFANLTNALGYQTKGELNNAFMVFEPQHPFILRAMEMVKSIFDPNRGEIHYGPLLVTRVYKQYIKTKKAIDDDPRYHITTLDVKYVYPMPYGSAQRQLMKVGSNPGLEANIREAYTHHLWRNKMRGLFKNPSIEPPEGSILHLIAKTHCLPALNQWMSPTKPPKR